MMLTPEQIEANQEGIAAAIRSIAFANSLMWVGVAVLLKDQKVATKEQFAAMVDRLVVLVGDKAPGESNTGAAMLEEVSRLLREAPIPSVN